MKSLKPASIKQENLKHAHGEVQNRFAKTLAQLMENPHGSELQCCITYSKPCGCIRKYVLGGEKWKDNPSLQLRNAEEIDPNMVAANDKQMLGHMEIERARELLAIYERAAELKKEKCYAFNNVEVEGKSLKELRGMIGLGNGRNRSKKYEDYVLQMRTKLRTDYNLCEKAAQKLLGYSINFLYKKLRTNPHKTSRLVATNKAERASKTPRHLIPLEELKEMGRNANSTNQCCGRNCISRLASQHFDKIEDWRRRLEGSGQRVAQEIVAEVLRASSSSLDGQSSFCQNLVHWVTGCSFKKIRRVRDHLKKDPQSLPEHGLKKYWKDKVKKKQNVEVPQQRFPKIEKQDMMDGEMMHLNNSMYYYSSGIQIQQQGISLPYSNVNETGYNSVESGGQQMMGHQSDSRESSMPNQWPGSNVNNSNNMLMPHASYETKPLIPSGYPPQLRQDKNRGTPDVQYQSNSYQYQNSSSQNQRHNVPYSSQDRATQLQALQQQRQMAASPYQTMPEANANPQYNPQHQYIAGGLKIPAGGNANIPQQSTGQVVRGSVILHTAGSQHQRTPQDEQSQLFNHNQAVESKHLHNRPHSFNTGQINTNPNEVLGMAFNPSQMYGQHYYIATPNNGQDNNFFQGGMAQGLTPFVLSNRDAENADDNKSNDIYRQPFYILSPIAGSSERGFSASDLKNFQQLPLTPIQILSTPYLQSGGNGEGANRQDPQQFLFPMPFANSEQAQSYENESGQDEKGGNINPTHFPGGAALTSMAVVHNGSGLFNLSPWQMPQGESADNNAQAPAHMENASHQWPLFALQQYPPNVTLDHVQGQAVMYNATQSHYPVTSVAQAVRSNWEGEAEKPTAALPTSTQSVNVNNQTDTRLSYENTANQTGEMNAVEVSVASREKDLHEDEKEGGIVTPKIIRDALSSNFGARSQESTAAVPPLAPINNKIPEAVKEVTKEPTLEMPKLAPIQSKSDSQQEGTHSPEDQTEDKCAPINSRLKRFSRDRLRATIDSPNIVLTPFTPLTPNMTPIIIAASASEDDTGKENSASSTGSKHDGSIFLFPPTHISRRAAALRLQGQTVSSKTKNAKDSPTTPGPFPVAEGEESPSSAKYSENTVNKKDGQSAEKTSEDVGKKSPALTLHSVDDSGDKRSKEKIPVIGFDAANWQADPSIPSPNMDTSEDSALNTPTQQTLNTPTSLHTPTQQLNTPNQDLKTPTESPVKSMHPGPSKRKRDLSPTQTDAAMLDESPTSAESKSNPPVAKSLRFHCFTPKDFNESVSCSAFRKPSEFASTPTDSAIAQRRRRPRKQAHPSSVSTPDDEIPDGMSEGHSSDDIERTDDSGNEDEKANSQGNGDATPKDVKSRFPGKQGFAGFARAPDGNLMMLGTPFESQPSFLQLVTPSLLSSSLGTPESSGRQQLSATPQVNTPVFLHSATFLTPNSNMLRKISPGVTQGVSDSSQVFTFMPSSLSTPKKLPKDTTNKNNPDVSGDQPEDKKESDDARTTSSGKKLKSGAVRTPVLSINISEAPSNPSSSKDSGLETPSNLKVVTPSLAINSANATVSAAEASQVFTFPSSSMPSSSTRLPPRSGLVFCVPSKPPPSASVLYHPLTSPSAGNGPVTLVPVELLTPTKNMRAKENINTDEQSSPKQQKISFDETDKNAQIIVDDSSSNDSHKAKNEQLSDNVVSVSTTSSSDVATATAAKASPKPKQQKSPKVAPQPLIMTNTNIENPNVQTPTMLHLVSPSHHNPNSPMVLYPMLRPPHGQPGMKLHSPLSGNSAAGTPPVMILQRFPGPGGSSSLLKSALMKSMPVFQFPPSTLPSTSSTATASPSSTNNDTAVVSTSSPTIASSTTTAALPLSDDNEGTATVQASSDNAATTPSVSVSVICSPRS